MTFLLVREDREYLGEPGDELHTDLGILSIPDSVSPDSTIETHLGNEFRVRRLRNRDLFNHFERTGAPLLPRDIGLIIGLTGVQTGDRVLDAGTGSGVLAAFLGRMGATVVSFEQNADFAAVARENMALAEVTDNVTVRSENVIEAIPSLSSEFDVITLDMKNAPAIVKHGDELLTPGGALSVYSPFVEAAKAAVTTAKETGLADVVTYETIQREMEFDDRGSRPTTRGVGHSGYLSFARNEPTLE